MRTLTISVCCTLAYLAGQKVIEEAKDNPNDKLPETPADSDRTEREKALTPDLANPTTSPETLSAQEFSQKAIADNLKSDPLPMKGQKGQLNPDDELEIVPGSPNNSPVSLLELSANAPWNQRPVVISANRSTRVIATTPVLSPATVTLAPAPITDEITASSNLPVVQSQSPQFVPVTAEPLVTGSAKDLIAIAPQQTKQLDPLEPSPALVADTSREVFRSDVQEIRRIQTELQEVEQTAEVDNTIEASPSLSIANPTAFGADNNTGFISATYQNRTRYTEESDGAIGVGVGLGDARRSVGVELSYTAASFGGSRDFGAGGFNVKLHRQLPDDWAVAAGWNGVVNVGGDNDFENSAYGVVSKVIRTREDINQPFSRVAVTAGIGTGQFRSEEAVSDDEGGIGAFGSVAVRVAKPVSVIAEWTGQDLGVGVSVAPFKNIPLVITPAVRDITGAGDGPRFVVGAGLAFKF